jgi:hypothetical protein
MEGSEGEVWKPVAGYVGYEVSSLGNVRSRKGRWSGGKPKMMKPTPIPAGYLTVALYSDGGRKTHLVHRMVADAFHERGGHDLVRHLDGDKFNNRAENLAWGTPSENAVDSVIHGTHRNTRKTHCKRGHEYTPENTYRFADMSRVCRTCAIARSNDNYHRAQAARKRGE